MNCLEICCLKRFVGRRRQLLCVFLVTVVSVHLSLFIWLSSAVLDVTPSNNSMARIPQHLVPTILRWAFENVHGNAMSYSSMTAQTTNLVHSNVNTSGIHGITRSFRHEPPKILHQTSGFFTKPPWLTHKTDFPLTIDGDYVINPADLCHTNGNVDCLIIVNSATTYFRKRQAIRQTFAAQLRNGAYRQVIVFLLGLSQDPDTTAKIQEESLRYGDIVQGAFHDSYHNLTHKSVMGLSWIADNCLQAKLILKLDDDVFINPFLFANELVPAFKPKNLQISCSVLSSKDPIHRGRHVWAVSEDEFRGLNFYPFKRCMGYFVMMSTDLILPMLQAARLNPFFWIDDVYVYGMLPATIGGVTFNNIRWRLAQTTQKFKNCYGVKGLKCTYVGVIHHNEGHALWRMLMERVPEDMKERYHLLDN